MNSVIRFATPHSVTFRDGGAVVTLPSSGAVHRLNGPAARVVRHVVGGNVNPSLWTRDEQDALAVLCDLGVLEFSEHSLNRRMLIAGASALGITTLAMPSAGAVAVPDSPEAEAEVASSASEGGGGGGGGGYFSGGNGDESTGGAGGGSVEGSGGNASDNSGGGGGGGGELAGNAGRGGRGFVAIRATPGIAVTEV